MLHLNYGGLEKQVSTLINELSKNDNKYDIEIISVYKLLDVPFYNLPKNVKIKYLLNYGPNKDNIYKSLKEKNILKLFPELIKGLRIVYLKYSLMKKEIKKLETDIIFSTRIEFSKFIKRKDTLNISQEHSYINTSKYISKVKKSFKYIDYLVVMTNKAKNNYESWLNLDKYNTKIICIPNMIRKTDEESNYNIDSKQIISIGRLHEVKDFDTLIDVYNLVCKTNSNWKLKIIGDGKERKNIEKKISEYKLEDRIILTGKLSESEIIENLKDSSIFVLTSKSESFSLVLCEAMSYGIPCVSFDIDVGPREIIEDNKSGFLIKDRNVYEMAEKINQLINNDELRSKFSEESKKISEKFFSNNIITNWEKLFNSQIK